MRIYLQLPPIENKAPRFCHLHLQEDLLDGWNLLREQGNQGSAGRVSRYHYEHHDQAIEALTKLKDDAIKKGYKMVFAEGESQ